VHLLLHVLGLDDASGRWYLFWSGPGADLGILGAVYGLYRRHNCEIRRCPRLGLHLTAAGARLCRKHHPDGHLTVEAAHAAHEEARRL
jgi:hypothetical protein